MRLFLFTLLMLASMSAVGQTMRVERFELDPTDLTAVSHETPDASGRPCALLKVMVLAPKLNFHGANLVRSENKGHNEYWLWLSPGAENVDIQLDGRVGQPVRFADHDAAAARLKGKHTYVLVLNVAQDAAGTCDVTFTCNAPTFALSIDGYPTDASMRTFPVPQGKHKVAATAEGFEDYVGEFELNMLSSDMEYAIVMTPTPTIPAEQARLAEQYLKDSNYARAFELFQRAAKKKDPVALNGIGDFYRYGYGVVEKDLDKAMSYYKKAAKSDLPVALYNVGQMLLRQTDWEFNGSAKYYRKAAEAGYAEAYYGLAVDFFYNNTKVMEFLTKGAELGHVGCMAELGVKFYKKKEYEKAFDYYTRAAEHGNPLAECNLAGMYLNGIATEKDTAKSFEMRCRSYAHGCTDSRSSANYNAARISANVLGIFYEQGLGDIEVDLEMARTWYGIGARMGHEGAIENYNRLAAQLR